MLIICSSCSRNTCDMRSLRAMKKESTMWSKRHSSLWTCPTNKHDNHLMSKKIPQKCIRPWNSKTLRSAQYFILLRKLPRKMYLLKGPVCVHVQLSQIPIRYCWTKNVYASFFWLTNLLLTLHCSWPSRFLFVLRHESFLMTLWMIFQMTNSDAETRFSLAFNLPFLN